MFIHFTILTVLMLNNIRGAPTATRNLHDASIIFTSWSHYLHECRHRRVGVMHIYELHKFFICIVAVQAVCTILNTGFGVEISVSAMAMFVYLYLLETFVQACCVPL